MIPDPVLMAAIANDTSKEVLIFKQSAGTGFDAPRAFVLASTKSVNDADFAMQFIGRGDACVAPDPRGISQADADSGQTSIPPMFIWQMRKRSAALRRQCKPAAQ